MNMPRDVDSSTILTPEKRASYGCQIDLEIGEISSPNFDKCVQSDEWGTFLECVADDNPISRLRIFKLQREPYK